MTAIIDLDHPTLHLTFLSIINYHLLIEKLWVSETRSAHGSTVAPKSYVGELNFSIDQKIEGECRLDYRLEADVEDLPVE